MGYDFPSFSGYPPARVSRCRASPAHSLRLCAPPYAEAKGAYGVPPSWNVRGLGGCTGGEGLDSILMISCDDVEDWGLEMGLWQMNVLSVGELDRKS